jgi:glycosyltransferase involved in cell wall biosynthesis
MSEDEKNYDLDKSVKTVSLLYKNEQKNFIVNNLKRFIRLKKYMKTEKCDVYIVFLPITIIMLLMLRRFTSAKIIASERGDPSRYTWVVRKVIKVLAKYANCWVFQTADVKLWYGNAISDSCVIPNAINQEFIRPRYSGARGKKIVGAGRLCDQKDFELLINSFADISNEFKDYSLTIYGEGIKRTELELLAKNRGIEERFFMPGYVKSLGKEMEDASVFVLSSKFEGMPNALMEAMALGVPCISTDCPVGGPRYLIQDGINGILIPVGDRQKLADSIRRLITDEEYSERLGMEGVKITNTLHPTVIYNEWEKCINRVVSEGVV